MNLNKMKATLLVGLLAFFSTTVGTINAQTRWDCCDRGFALCPAQPCCEDCGFFIGGDFIYWNVFQANLDYAVDGRNDELSGPSVVEDGGFGPGKMHFMDYDWDPGFRVTAGWRFGCDGWDARVVYTYFRSEASGSASANDTSGSARQLLEATLLSAEARLNAQNAEDATAKNCLDYDVIDVLLSRPFCISQTLIARPYLGVRAVWLDQDLKATYTGGEEIDIDSPSLISNDSPREVKYESEWEGAGLHAGIETSIRLCGCFSLYGNVSGSILAGQSCTHNKQTGFDSGGLESDLQLIVDIKEKECTALPGYHLGAGVNWETELCDTCIVLNLGYEMTQWLHTPQIRRYSGEDQHAGSTSANSGNILLHGVTLNANIYF